MGSVYVYNNTMGAVAMPFGGRNRAVEVVYAGQCREMEKERWNACLDTSLQVQTMIDNGELLVMTMPKDKARIESLQKKFERLGRTRLEERQTMNQKELSTAMQSQTFQAYFAD